MRSDAWFDGLKPGDWVMVGNSLDGWRAAQVERRTATQVIAANRRFGKNGEIGRHRTGIRAPEAGELERDAAMKALTFAFRELPRFETWRGDLPKVDKAVTTEDIAKAAEWIRQAVALLRGGD